MNVRSLYRCIPVLIAVLCSCAAPRHVTYLQNAATVGTQPIAGTYKVNIQYDDQLSIVVSSKDSILAAPFNKSSSGGYLVNADGRITLPVLGPMSVVRMTTDSLANLLQQRLIKEDYIRDATVSVKLLNFKVSVIGEVTRPGVFPVSTERLTILEALSMAGDLSIYGKRDSILVVREKDGMRSMQYLDIQSANIFSSPYYYLQQNDVVYVVPNKAKAVQGDYKTKVLPYALSGASVLVAIASLLILTL